ncbi:hypothetical protein J0910_30640 [Nocardiopsis sp. CNT-189]|uniref:hypothetical protein n=1 Tax=Nocardiopsis oceanisediminis TaxID=2816862 RepID=UPI003B360BA1
MTESGISLPNHTLTADEADHAAALQFGDSTVRLADIARRSGRATEAAEELWPLTARLEALLAEGRVDAPVVGLLARPRTALGVCLGHLLAEEQLHAAARWTGRALVLAEQLDEPELHAHVLRMHGNELRKAGRPAAPTPPRCTRSSSPSTPTRPDSPARTSSPDCAAPAAPR